MQNNNMPQPPNFLSNLLGGGPNNNGGNANINGGGLTDTIRQLPARGMQILNNVLSGVRNMLPNLGRNGECANIESLVVA